MMSMLENKSLSVRKPLSSRMDQAALAFRKDVFWMALFPVQKSRFSVDFVSQ